MTTTAKNSQETLWLTWHGESVQSVAPSSKVTHPKPSSSVKELAWVVTDSHCAGWEGGHTGTLSALSLETGVPAPSYVEAAQFLLPWYPLVRLAQSFIQVGQSVQAEPTLNYCLFCGLSVRNDKCCILRFCTFIFFLITESYLGLGSAYFVQPQKVDRAYEIQWHLLETCFHGVQDPQRRCGVSGAGVWGLGGSRRLRMSTLEFIEKSIQLLYTVVAHRIKWEKGGVWAGAWLHIRGWES